MDVIKLFMPQGVDQAGQLLQFSLLFKSHMFKSYNSFLPFPSIS